MQDILIYIMLFQMFLAFAYVFGWISHLRFTKFKRIYFVRFALGICGAFLFSDLASIAIKVFGHVSNVHWVEWLWPLVWGFLFGTYATEHTKLVSESDILKSSE